jgi:hypothetical protein
MVSVFAVVRPSQHRDATASDQGSCSPCGGRSPSDAALQSAPGHHTAASKPALNPTQHGARRAGASRRFGAAGRSPRASSLTRFTHPRGRRSCASRRRSRGRWRLRAVALPPRTSPLAERHLRRMHTRASRLLGGGVMATLGVPDRRTRRHQLAPALLRDGGIGRTPSAPVDDHIAAVRRPLRHPGDLPGAAAHDAEADGNVVHEPRAHRATYGQVAGSAFARRGGHHTTGRDRRVPRHRGTRRRRAGSSASSATAASTPGWRNVVADRPRTPPGIHSSYASSTRTACWDG